MRSRTLTWTVAAVVTLGLVAAVVVVSRDRPAVKADATLAPAVSTTTSTTVATDTPLASEPAVVVSTTLPATTTTSAPPSPTTTVVLGAGGYSYVPKPVSAQGTIAPGGALTKHLAADVGAAFGFPAGEIEAAIASVVLPPEAAGNPEGWLAPGSYGRAESATDLIQTMVDRRVAQLEDRGIPRDQWHRVLTAASVIEKETYNQTEKPGVARVLANRLAGGGPLQMDSIILYPVPEDRIFTTAGERAADQPYNSYRFDGLPPTPICAPDEASIDAFLNPPSGDWFFYVTVDLHTGQTLYAITYDEHLTNVQLLRAWLRDNPTR